jgi:hypothetical protein
MQIWTSLGQLAAGGPSKTRANESLKTSEMLPTNLVFHDDRGSTEEFTTKPRFAFGCLARSCGDSPPLAWTFLPEAETTTSDGPAHSSETFVAR